MKVLLRTPLSPYSGYGRDGIGLAYALLDRGHDVRLSPTHVDPPLPVEVASLLCSPIDPPFDVALHHQEPEKCDLTLSDTVAARHNVLWTMWGWQTLPDEAWVQTWHERTQHYDDVVLYDPLSAQTLTPITAHPERIKVLVGGYRSEEWTERTPRPPHDGFVFGMNGRLTLRKGVYTAYEAFATLTERHPDWDVRLRLRSVEAIFPPGMQPWPGVSVEVGRWSAVDLRHFYASLDTLLAPSLAESKHLPPIEALTVGTPVIASDIVGHRTWATSDLVTFVGGTPTGTVLPDYRSPKVGVDALVEAMETHYLQRAEQQRKADLARRTLPAMLDWTRCVERLGLATGLRL